MTQPPAPAPQRIHELLDRWVQAQPDAPAVRDAHTALGYAALDQAARKAADRLQALGVRPGDRVLMVGENCVALCVLVLALSRVGAWSVTVNARLSAREIDEFVAHSGARRVLYTAHVSADAARHAERHGATAGDWPGMGPIQIGPLAAQALPEPVGPDAAQQTAAMIYTSGTSGAPKGVMLSHANLLFAADTLRNQRRFTPGDVMYGVLPMAHVVGLSIQFLGTIHCGAALVLEPRFSARGLAQALAAGGVTAFTGVPAMYAQLLEHRRTTGGAWAQAQLRFIGVAGSPLTPSLKAEVEQLLGLPLHNGYGLTETAPTVAQTTLGQQRDDCAVGHPIPGVQIRLVNREGRAVEPGGVGELHVRGPNVMQGYFHNPAQTALAIDAEGWFNTGDLARLSDDGALHIVGRTRELIIRSGFNVYPVEVEQALNAYPEVVQSAVVGRTVGHNEEVVAFVQTTQGIALDEEALRAHLREHLSPYKVPSEIRFLAALPAAPTGKVLKNVLKTLAQQPAGTALPAAAS
jgi:long-chain acyl-CoA synthetase